MRCKEAARPTSPRKWTPGRGSCAQTTPFEPFDPDQRFAKRFIVARIALTEYAVIAVFFCKFVPVLQAVTPGPR